MRVGLCFRHFSSWSQQLPHGGMHQECQRQLPGIRESLCGNRRGWRREQVKEVWQWIAHFSRCPARIAEWASSRTRIKSLKHGKGEKSVAVCIDSTAGFSTARQIINWNAGGATNKQTQLKCICVCAAVNRLLWPYHSLRAGSVKQRLASRCNSSHSCRLRQMREDFKLKDAMRRWRFIMILSHV